MRDNPSLEMDHREIVQQEIAQLAHELWGARGCPEGSPERDWFLAEEQLRSQQSSSMAHAA